MSETETHSLLIIDDDERFRERLAVSFRRRGYRVTTACGKTEAVRICGEQTFSAAVVDLRMPDGNGLELIGAFREIQPCLHVLILTGYGSVSTAKDALRKGAVDYLMKPTDADEIEKVLFPSSTDSSGEPSTEPPVPSLERVEWEHIQRILADTENNISEAARRLGIERRTLQRKLQKHPPKR